MLLIKLILYFHILITYIMMKFQVKVKNYKFSQIIIYEFYIENL